MSIDIDASPMAVTEVLLDASAAPLWTSGLERLELVEGTAGLAGSLGRAHYREGSRVSVLEDRLIEAVPGRRFVSEISGEGIRATVETTLEGTAEGGTHLTLCWKGAGTNPVSRLVLPLMRRSVRTRSRKDLEALRTLVEERSRRSQGRDEPTP